MNLEETVFVTLDIDWAPDEVVEFSADLLEELAIPATYFVTHQSPALRRLRDGDFELGIHPNFNPLLDGGGTGHALQIIQELKKIVPEATSVRSHSLTRSARLSSLFHDLGFRHESNFLVPVWRGFPVWPFEHPEGLIQVIHNWGDHAFLENGEASTADSYLACRGLKALNLHPIHLFLNTPDLTTYAVAKKQYHSYRDLKAHVNGTQRGVRQFLEELTAGVRRRGYRFDNIKKIEPIRNQNESPKRLDTNPG